MSAPTAYFYDATGIFYWDNSTNTPPGTAGDGWFSDSACTTPLGRIPVDGDFVYLLTVPADLPAAPAPTLSLFGYDDSACWATIIGSTYYGMTEWLTVSNALNCLMWAGNASAVTGATVQAYLIGGSVGNNANIYTGCDNAFCGNNCTFHTCGVGVNTPVYIGNGAIFSPANGGCDLEQLASLGDGAVIDGGTIGQYYSVTISGATVGQTQMVAIGPQTAISTTVAFTNCDIYTLNTSTYATYTIDGGTIHDNSIIPSGNIANSVSIGPSTAPVIGAGVFFNGGYGGPPAPNITIYQFTSLGDGCNFNGCIFSDGLTFTNASIGAGSYGQQCTIGNSVIFTGCTIGGIVSWGTGCTIDGGTIKDFGSGPGSLVPVTATIGQTTAVAIEQHVSFSGCDIYKVASWDGTSGGTIDGGTVHSGTSGSHQICKGMNISQTTSVTFGDYVDFTDCIFYKAVIGTNATFVSGNDWLRCNFLTLGASATMNGSQATAFDWSASGLVWTITGPLYATSATPFNMGNHPAGSMSFTGSVVPTTTTVADAFVNVTGHSNTSYWLLNMPIGSGLDLSMAYADVAAVQLATDTAEVESKKSGVLNTTTILGVRGTAPVGNSETSSVF